MLRKFNRTGLWRNGFLGIVLLFPVQGWPEENRQEEPRLTVSAKGKIDLPPDKAELSFAVETVGERLADVQQENQEQLAKVLNECRIFNIPSKFIQTTSLNVIPEYPPPPRRPAERTLENNIPQIIGYRIVHHVNVEVHDLEIVGKLVDRVLKVGANRFSGLSWGLQNNQPIKLKVLQQASMKAQAKAETLAQALNLNLVRLTKVLEGGELPSPHEERFRVASMARDGGGEAPISAGQISIHGTVTLVYEISQK